MSCLILMNSAPASHGDFIRFRQERRKKAAGDLDLLKELSCSSRYEDGDLEMDAEYYRIHFRTALRQPQHLERVIKSLRVNFTNESIRIAREIEKRLMDDTCRQ